MNSWLLFLKEKEDATQYGTNDGQNILNNNESSNSIDKTVDDDNIREDRPIDITSRFADLSTDEAHSGDGAEMMQQQKELEKQNETKSATLFDYDFQENVSKDSGHDSERLTDGHKEKLNQSDRQTNELEEQSERQTEQTNNEIKQNKTPQAALTKQHGKQTNLKENQLDRQTDTPNEEKTSTWNIPDDSGKLLTSDELIKLCQHLHHSASGNEGFTTIGMVSSFVEMHLFEKNREFIMPFTQLKGIVVLKCSKAVKSNIKNISTKNWNFCKKVTNN